MDAERHVQGALSGDTSAVLAAYTPVLANIQTGTEADDYYDTVYDLICDAVNQTGVEEPLNMSSPEAAEHWRT
jgi:hypothetical protein